MRYQDHIQKFWELNQNMPLGSSAITLYLFLINNWYNNQNSVLTLSDVMISKNIGLATRSVKRNKDKLKTFGLIDFYTKNGSSSQYTIINPNQISLKKSQLEPKEEEKDIPISKTIEKIEVVIPNEKPRLPPPELYDPNIPSLDEFLEYTSSLLSYEIIMDEPLRKLYKTLLKNGWKNAYDRPIVNWKTFIKKQLPFLNSPSTTSSLQTINRPVSSKK